MDWQEGLEVTAWDLVSDDTWQDTRLKAYLLPYGRVGWEAADPVRSLQSIRLQRLDVSTGKLIGRSCWVKPGQRIVLRGTAND